MDTLKKTRITTEDEGWDLQAQPLCRGCLYLDTDEQEEQKEQLPKKTEQ